MYVTLQEHITESVLWGLGIMMHLMLTYSMVAIYSHCVFATLPSSVITAEKVDATHNLHRYLRATVAKYFKTTDTHLRP